MDVDTDDLAVDCGGCLNRGAACAACVVTAIIRESTGPLLLSAGERRAIAELAAGGLGAPLRYAPAVRAARGGGGRPPVAERPPRAAARRPPRPRRIREPDTAAT